MTRITGLVYQIYKQKQKEHRLDYLVYHNKIIHVKTYI